MAFRILFFSCKFCKDHGGALEWLQKQSCQKLAGVCRRVRGAHFSQGGEQALPWEEEHGPDRVFPVAERESRQRGGGSCRRRHYAAQQHLGTGEGGSPPRSLELQQAAASLRFPFRPSRAANRRPRSGGGARGHVPNTRLSGLTVVGGASTRKRPSLTYRADGLQRRQVTAQLTSFEDSTSFSGSVLRYLIQCVRNCPEVY